MRVAFKGAAETCRGSWCDKRPLRTGAPSLGTPAPGRPNHWDEAMCPQGPGAERTHRNIYISYFQTRTCATLA